MIGALLRPMQMPLARLLARVKLFDHAQALYIRALNDEPEGIALCRVYVGLAQTEFCRGHFLNSRHYARLCLEQMAAGAVQEGEPGAETLLDEASWFYESSEEAARNARRAPPLTRSSLRR